MRRETKKSLMEALKICKNLYSLTYKKINESKNNSLNKNIAHTISTIVNSIKLCESLENKSKRSISFSPAVRALMLLSLGYDSPEGRVLDFDKTISDFLSEPLISLKGLDIVTREARHNLFQIAKRRRIFEDDIENVLENAKTAFFDIYQQLDDEELDRKLRIINKKCSQDKSRDPILFDNFGDEKLKIIWDDKEQELYDEIKKYVEDFNKSIWNEAKKEFHLAEQAYEDATSDPDFTPKLKKTEKEWMASFKKLLSSITDEREAEKVLLIRQRDISINEEEREENDIMPYYEDQTILMNLIEFGLPTEIKRYFLIDWLLPIVEKSIREHSIIVEELENTIDALMATLEELNKEIEDSRIDEIREELENVSSELLKEKSVPCDFNLEYLNIPDANGWTALAIGLRDTYNFQTKAKNATFVAFENELNRILNDENINKSDYKHFTFLKEAKAYYSKSTRKLADNLDMAWFEADYLSDKDDEVEKFLASKNDKKSMSREKYPKNMSIWEIEEIEQGKKNI